MNALQPWRLVLIALALFVTTTPLKAQEKVVAYDPNWIDLEALSNWIDSAKITPINIAFENPIKDRGELSFHRKDDVLIAKAHTCHDKLMVSIGVGAEAGHKTLRARGFDVLSGPERAEFAARLASYVIDHGFDGLDADLEGSSINQDNVAFTQDLSVV